MASLNQDQSPSGAQTDLLGPVKKHLGFVALFSAFYNVLFLAPSLYMLQVYDRVLTTGGINTLLFLSAILVFSLAILAILDRLRNAILVRASLKLDNEWAQPIIRAAMRQGASPEAQNALRDFDQLRQTITSASITALCDAPWTPLYVLICFIIHPILGGVALGGILLLILLAYVNNLIAAKSTQAMMGQQNAHYNNQSTLNNAADIVGTLGMTEPLARLRAQERVGFVDGQAKVSLQTGGISAFTRFVRLVLQSTAIGLGGYLAVQGLMSPGSIIAASIIMSRSLMPIDQLIQAWRPLTTALKSLSNVVQAIDENTQAKRERMALPAPQGKISIDKLSYAINDVPILNNISFDMGAGEILGIVGPSGAGKTTLARLIAGAMDPTDGEIQLDGVRYSDWGSERLARHLGYLPQAAMLLPGTIGDNISRFESKMTELDADTVAQNVIISAERAGVDMLVKTAFPMGYDTVIGPNGVNPSAGQSQRIGLARAIYNNPALVVLDEPNSNLDAPGEAKLLSVMDNLRANGQSVVLIAHRAGILKHCTKLLVLNQGQIEHYGPADDVRAELAKTQPAMRPKLVKS